MTKVAMLYDLMRWEEKSLVDAAKRKNVELVPVDTRELVLDVEGEYKDKFGDIVLQRSISHYRSLQLTCFLEQKGLPVVNSFQAALISSNKLYTAIYLANHGVPIPKSMLAFTREAALSAFDQLGYPSVLKPTQGSWGRLIALVNDRDAAEAVLEDREHMFPMYQVYYLQEKVKRPPRDIRSFVIGDRVVAAIYRVAQTGQWKTNTALGGKAVNCPITGELEDISLKAAKAVGDGIFGVDAMETENGLVIHEVNNTIEFKNTVPATGIDIPGLILDYLTEHAR